MTLTAGRRFLLNRPERRTAEITMYYRDKMLKARMMCETWWRTVASTDGESRICREFCRHGTISRGRPCAAAGLRLWVECRMCAGTKLSLSLCHARVPKCTVHRLPICDCIYINCTLRPILLIGHVCCASCEKLPYSAPVQTLWRYTMW